MRASLCLLPWCLIALSTPTVDCLLSILQEIVFPKNPILMKTRNPAEARAYGHLTTLHFIALVQRHGYPAEEHNVTTADGYRLALHRIPNSPLIQAASNNKPVVFLQHGILASSDIWVLHGPKKDLAFLLADAGYDVWMGNVRGNTYCRSHVTLSTADPEFWKFSYTEMALNDVPTAINYILDLTGRKTLQYIGHSMGTTIIYVLLSIMPEYNEKLSLAISLAPVAYWKHNVTAVLELLLPMAPEVKEILDSGGIYDIAPQSAINGLLGKKFCSSVSISQPICTWLFMQLSGMDPEQLNTTLLPYYLQYFPAGGSTQTMYHFSQNIITHTFAMFDHGSAEENLNHYNEVKPPAYEVEKATAPMALIYGLNDALVNREDVLELRERLPNIVYFEEVPYKNFTHLDFVWAIEAKALLYDRLIELMNKFRD